MKAFYRLVLLVLSITWWNATAVTADEIQRAKYNAQAEKAFSSGNQAEGERLYRAAISEADDAQLVDSTLASSLDGLGSAFWYKRKYAEAEPLFKRCLQVHEKLSGVESAAFTQALRRLAGFYYSQAKYAEAIPLHERELAISERKYGANSPQLASPLRSLAGLYQIQGMYSEAVPLSLRLLAIEEQEYGADHRVIVASLRFLSGLYRDQAKYAEAEVFCQRACAIEERTLGADHPNHAQTLYLLRVLYQRQKKYGEAIVLQRRVVAIREKSSEVDLSSRAMDRLALALLLEIQGETEEATKLEAQTLEDLRRLPRSRDTSSAERSTKKADECYNKGNYSVAETEYHNAVYSYQHALGPDHPLVGRRWFDISSAVAKQGREKEAAAYFRRADRTRDAFPK